MRAITYHQFGSTWRSTLVNKYPDATKKCLEFAFICNSLQKQEFVAFLANHRSNVKHLKNPKFLHSTNNAPNLFFPKKSYSEKSFDKKERYHLKRRNTSWVCSLLLLNLLIIWTKWRDGSWKKSNFEESHLRNRKPFSHCLRSWTTRKHDTK